MTVKVHWFLPTSGDSRTVIPFGPDGHSRPPTLDYLAQVAQAADRLGYEGVLTPTGTWCEDAYWFAEGVFPLLRQRGLLAPAQVPAGASGRVFSRVAPTSAR